MIYLAILLALIAVLIIGAEIILRKNGARPWRPVNLKNLRIEPSDGYYVPDEIVGWRHGSGTFTIWLTDTYSTLYTHRQDGLRITRPQEQEQKFDGKPQVWVFGCSHTHGQSLNDEDTYPWILQKMLQDYDVVNFGVDGYGTLQSFLQFEKALEDRPEPEVVILAYGHFHDRRNTMSRTRRKVQAHVTRLQLSVPYARLDRQGKLVVRRMPVTYREFPFMRRSALVHEVEKNYNWLLDKLSRKEEISRMIVQNFDRVCKSKGIRFIVAGMVKGFHTRGMMAYCRDNGISAVDIAVDLGTQHPEFTNLPYDNHPNGKANQIYAGRLAEFLANKEPASVEVDR